MSNSKKLSVALSSILVLMLLVDFGSSNIDQDRAECAEQLVGLAPCLPYVGGDAKAPTLDCCTGIKEVEQKSKKCLCVLIKDRNDPNLGLKINATLALQLPTSCHVPVNISKCVGNSTSNGTVTQAKSDGVSLEKRLLGVEMLFGSLALMWFYT
ncbi:protein YLS3-like isoform X2 [Prunus dulcis]|uniref:protein YLS3-like isoform X2 n=1 Tax=Prunus dulcis TaxID=3755 RepID=UPI0014828FF7|nr:protein YLS3-like isoform X2 [Prunus dulcis]